MFTGKTFATFGIVAKASLENEMLNISANRPEIIFACNFNISSENIMSCISYLFVVSMSVFEEVGEIFVQGIDTLFCFF